MRESNDPTAMMGNGQITHTVQQVARVFRDGTFVGMSDRQILERFVENHDTMAFEAILTRHGPMVRRVCRQMLRNSHDVDDAVQAVFLVFVRKARWIWIEGSLGPWLYTVAGRVAARRGRIGESDGNAKVRTASNLSRANACRATASRSRRSFTTSWAGYPSGCGGLWCSATSKD